MSGQSDITVADTYDEAARWHLRLQNGPVSQSMRRDFERWYATDDNAAAYGAVARSWSAAAAVPDTPAARGDPRLAGMIDAAHNLGKRPARRSRVAAVLGVALLATSGVVAWMVRESSGIDTSGMSETRPSPAHTYVTAVGERSTFTLEDGSQVALNTNSRLQVAYGPDARRLTLLSGQALFDASHDPARPFIVRAGSHDVVALGTSFDVRLDQRSLQVTLIEGSVRVEDSADTGPAGRPATRLDPGQQYLSAGQAPEVRSARVDQVTSWRDGKLIFSDEPLGAAVAEVNRYSARKVLLADDRLADLRISGVFRTGRPDSFVAAVTGYFPISARDDAATGGLVLTSSEP